MRGFFGEHRQWFEDRVRMNVDQTSMVAKLGEEVGEVMAAICRRDPAALEDGIGDVIITACSLARMYGIDPHRALNDTWKGVRERDRDRVANRNSG